MEPKYSHDCQTCVFVGHDSDGDDIYWCPSHYAPYPVLADQKEECIVVRYCSELSEEEGVITTMELLYERSSWHRLEIIGPYTLSLLSTTVRAGYICKTVADCILSGVEST